MALLYKIYALCQFPYDYSLLSNVIKKLPYLHKRDFDQGWGKIMLLLSFCSALILALIGQADLQYLVNYFTLINMQYSILLYKKYY